MSAVLRLVVGRLRYLLYITEKFLTRPDSIFSFEELKKKNRCHKIQKVGVPFDQDLQL